MRVLLTVVGVAAASFTPTAAAPAAATQAVMCGGEVATIVGTARADVLVGTPQRDVIHGLGGRDRIRGLGGNDVICGGGGRDRLHGGPGDDVVFGASGADRMRGRHGYDVLHGGSGDDVARGGNGGDVIHGGPGADRVLGGADVDVCFDAASRSCNGSPNVRRSKLTAGESLLVGQKIASRNGTVRLAMGADGNVTLWRNGIDLWDTDTSSHPDARLTMDRGGALAVIWRGETIWSSDTDTPDSFAKLRNDANLVIKTPAFAPIWSRRDNPGIPDWHLPYPIGESWQAGAPHGENLSSLDFGPHDGYGDVVAVASGVPGWYECQSGGKYLKIEHGNGYMSTYYHLVDIRTELIGRWIEAGTVIGRAGNAVPCGGRSTFTHVHLTLWRNGIRQSADGMMIRDYSVHAGSQPYHGHWKETATGDTILVNVGGAACCLPNNG